MVRHGATGVVAGAIFPGREVGDETPKAKWKGTGAPTDLAVAVTLILTLTLTLAEKTARALIRGLVGQPAVPQCTDN